MKYLRLALLPLAFFSAHCLAHEDRVLDLAPDGALTGLPPDYAPGRLTLGFANVEGERRLTALTLSIHGVQVVLPMCVLGLLNTERREDVQVTASWDHDEDIVPHYLQLKLFDPGYQPRAWANAGFSLLFNLHDAKLMQMDVEVVHEKVQRTQSVPVDLRARCSGDDTEGFLSPAAMTTTR